MFPTNSSGSGPALAWPDICKVPNTTPEPDPISISSLESFQSASYSKRTIPKKSSSHNESESSAFNDSEDLGEDELGGGIMPNRTDYINEIDEEYMYQTDWPINRHFKGSLDEGFGIDNDSIGNLSETTATMNMQFLALQNAMQSESRKYQTMSNAIRARHDIAMTSIRNAKA